MTRGSDSSKASQWRRRMARFQNSQHSIVEFCRREGVSTPSFYQWRKKLAAQQSEAEEAGDPPPGFTPVRLVGSTGVAVELPGGTQLHIPTADARALELTLQTLARMDAERAGGASC